MPDRNLENMGQFPFLSLFIFWTNTLKRRFSISSSEAAPLILRPHSKKRLFTFDSPSLAATFHGNSSDEGWERILFARFTTYIQLLGQNNDTVIPTIASWISRRRRRLVWEWRAVLPGGLTPHTQARLISLLRVSIKLAKSANTLITPQLPLADGVWPPQTGD